MEVGEKWLFVKSLLVFYYHLNWGKKSKSIRRAYVHTIIIENNVDLRIKGFLFVFMLKFLVFLVDATAWAPSATLLCTSYTVCSILLLFPLFHVEAAKHSLDMALYFLWPFNKAVCVKMKDSRSLALKKVRHRRRLKSPRFTELSMVESPRHVNLVHLTTAECGDLHGLQSSGKFSPIFTIEEEECEDRGLESSADSIRSVASSTPSHSGTSTPREYKVFSPRTQPLLIKRTSHGLHQYSILLFALLAPVHVIVAALNLPLIVTLNGSKIAWVTWKLLFRHGTFLKIKKPQAAFDRDYQIMCYMPYLLAPHYCLCGAKFFTRSRRDERGIGSE